MIGTTVSHYRILEKLGAGGMGEVYLAEDTKLDRKVALKFLPAALQEDADARARLLREARAASQLHHPNIVTIHSIEETDGRDFIVMEHVQGIPLTEYVERQKPHPEQLLGIFHAICRGLASAHAAGIVHRDLKPDNILVASDGRVRILDFGVARQAGTPRLTQTGSMIGTMAYVSPEQVQGGEATAASDQFALGVLMYELLSGRKPFTGDHEAAILYAIVNEDPEALSRLNPQVSMQIEHVVARCLAKRPADRFASIEAVAQALSPAAETAARVYASPATHYAKSGSTNIAYQVFGDGDMDLVLVLGWVSHVELIWQHEAANSFLQGLGDAFRVILFDKRGTGLSDRVAELPSLEQRMDDVRAVMDAAHSRRAVLLGVSEGGPMCALFAATYPERTRSLVMYGSYPVRIRDNEFPWAPTRAEREAYADLAERSWGGPFDLEKLAPSLSADGEFARWFSMFCRQSASPGGAAALLRMNSQVDIRAILPTIRVPTLVMHRTDDGDSRVEGSRWMAERIPGARFVELAGRDHLPWVGDSESLLRHLREFVTDANSATPVDTVLLTALCCQFARQVAPATVFEGVSDLLSEFTPRRVEHDSEGLIALFDGPMRGLRAATKLAQSTQLAPYEWTMGLHIGECSLFPTHASGRALDVASHLCGLLRPHTILLSSTIRELVGGSGFSFAEAGETRVGGIDHTWQILSLATPESVAPTTTRPSIAVLPFANMSADPENEFFADGLAEELINALTKIEGLRVAARTSAFSFKGKDAHVRDVGRQLDVGTILEGSVRRSGNKVRITAQLVKCDDGYHLWSDRFDRDLNDVFQIQDEITEAIVEHLKVRLLGETRQVMVRRPTVNVDALTLYMKGRYFWNKRTEANLDRGVEFFQKALQIDPDYPMAHVGLADAQNLYGFYNLRPPGEAFPRAREAAQRALALDGSVAAAHTSLAYVQFYHDWDWEEAEKTFVHAQSLDPSYAFAFSFHGNLLLALRRYDEAVARWTHSLKLDPLAHIQNVGVGYAHYHARRFDQAIESMRSALEMHPAFMVGHLFIGRAYEHAGRLDDAICSFQRAVELSERMPNTLAELGRAYAKSGDRERATALLEELEAAASKRYVCPSDLALLHMALGNADTAFQLMDRAADIRSPDLVMMNVDARMDPFRGDPRFESVVKKVGLPS